MQQAVSGKFDGLACVADLKPGVVDAPLRGFGA
jgi:hypothetical protein